MQATYQNKLNTTIIKMSFECNTYMKEEPDDENIQIKQEFEECNGNVPIEDNIVDSNQEDDVSDKEEFDNAQDKNNLADSESLDSEQTTFPCPTCFQEYGNIKDLQLHIDSKHLGLKVPCPVCDKYYCNNNYLKKHIQQKHPKYFRTSCTPLTTKKKIKPLRTRCSLCAKSFNSISELNQHLNIHFEKKFQCSFCSRKFSSDFCVKRHIGLVHLGINYQCNVCKVTLSDKVTLKSHMNNHLGIKPFECIYCDKRFTLKIMLNNHIKTHFKIKKHECPMCDEKFHYQIELTRHLISNHNGGYLHEPGPGPSTNANLGVIIRPINESDEIIIP